jgi:hypothetical protein
MDVEVVVKHFMVFPKHLPEEKWEKPWKYISQDSKYLNACCIFPWQISEKTKCV